MNEENFDNEPVNSEQPEVIKAPDLPPSIPAVVIAFVSLFTIFLLYQGMGGIATILFLGYDLSKANPTLVRLFTIGGQALFILLPSFIVVKLAYGEVKKFVRLRLPSLREFGLFFIGFLLIMPIIENLTYIQTWMIDNMAKSNGAVKQFKDFFDSMDKVLGDSYNQLFSVKGALDVFLILLSVSITPAICEEFFFRGLIQRSFGVKWKPMTAIVVSSLFFALYHFSPYGLIPLFILSIFLGYSAYKSDSILVPAFIHFANNFFMIILYFIVGDQAINSRPAENSGSITPYVAFLFFNIVLFFIWLFFVRRFYRKPETN